MRVALLLALLVSSAALGQTTELYRSVGEDGTVTFSDRPQGSDAEAITLFTRSGTTAPAAPASAQPPTVQRNAALAPNTSSEEIAAQMAENCRLAQTELDGLMVSDRFYRVLADGEREFLSDEEVAAARTQAQAQVAAWCNREQPTGS
jgi:hypothetical protein